MGYAEIRDGLVAILNGMETDAGIVHGYERWASDWGAFLTRFQASDDSVRGWTVTRRKTAARAGPRGLVERTHTYELRGVMGLEDASATEHDFQAMVEAVCEAVWTAGHEVGSPRPWRVGPVQVETVENRMFGHVLCHCAVLTVEVVETGAYRG